MIQIVLLISLISSACGRFVLQMSPTFYQAEESDNVSIRWDSENKVDLSLTSLDCSLQSEPVRVLYLMLDGVEHPESQHQQFAGRVQLDRDALREGRIRLLLSTVRVEDSGSYWCHVAANYDSSTVQGLRVTERFVLDVHKNSDGEIRHESLIKPTSGLRAAEEGQQEITGSAVAPIILLALICVFVGWKVYKAPSGWAGEGIQQPTQTKTSDDIASVSRWMQIMRRSYLPCELIQHKVIHQHPKLLQV